MDFQKYINLVEKSDDEVLIEYMNSEIEFILRIIKNGKYDVYDLGSGYGRIIPHILNYASSLTAIELDPGMFNGLKEKVKEGNVTMYENDITVMSEYIDINPNQKPLILLCQNTIGSLIGDVHQLVDQILCITSETKAELVVSVFNKESLNNYGIKLYTRLKELSGKIDFQKSDIHEGLIKMKAGYESKWWDKKEIQELFGDNRFQFLDEIESKHYSIYHLKIN